ncbi:class I SAM-dependent methyltransferase [Paenibacillus mendelii]|uniref:Class I SAM-dependent methyltransferase n=1 Tax=Paenibacillus mendelii TaxID=206163 RepID=A0ABV6JF11_9BACL|nr:methyltransferase domain-containing protein [Paenibacillus mendelii]MCQ6563397.1 methyltransferase domain-containing protein [Paenibacillus mendelii]
MTNSKALFLRKFLDQPKQVGSVLPSSGFLARSMIGAVPWHEVRSVAELGAGPGAITRYLMKAMNDGTHAFLFEKDPVMLAMLKQSYGGCICSANAEQLRRVIQQLGVSELDAVVSGLPFYNFSQPIRDQLLHQIECALKPGGRFVAFQYSLQMRKQLARRFVIEQVRVVPLNFPPAVVYVCGKKEDLR